MTSHPLRHLTICISIALICVLTIGCLGSGSSTGSNLSSGSVSSGSNLAAADDIPETGLQGQIPLVDQLSGKSAKGYRKGLKLVGQNTIMDRGANFAMGWVDNCAYVTTSSAAQLVGAPQPYVIPIDSPLNGMAVIDASNPAKPELVSILQSPAMFAPHESIQGNQARKIVVATYSMGAKMDIYDASDCRHPVLKSTLTIQPDIAVDTVDFGTFFRGHAMCLSPDGMTAYATGTPISNAAVDLTDLANPKLIKIFTPAAHDCGVSPDGNRLYLAVFGGAVFGPAETAFAGVTGIVDQLMPSIPALGDNGAFNGLMILDVSQFQQHIANPQMPEISELPWSDASEGEVATAGSHTARFFKQGNRSYIYSSDEWPTDVACPWAHSRIIDITDEKHPVKVSDITLDVAKSANCATTVPDLANYSAHYVGIDNPDNATTLFTTNYSAGLRVWDIHDVTKPKEIAYFHPVPVANTGLLSLLEQGALADGSLWDDVPTYVRYIPESGQIWIAGYTSGFQILEFTQSAGSTAPRPTGN